jgi:SAM-dependent methyltransferase
VFFITLEINTGFLGRTRLKNANPSFEDLVTEAREHPFSGWDFSYISKRMREDSLPWDYRARVRAAFASVQTLLDIGTGGGEFLASLQPLPPHTYATEAYAPNVPIATARLKPFGVRVEAVESESHLPFADSFFDLVINRHESFSAEEIFRVLNQGGRYITQQVGERNLLGLNEWLQCDDEERPSYYQQALDFLGQAGFEIIASRESFADTFFTDVGAVVYYLKAVPWQAPSYSIDKCYERLRAMHDHIQANGKLVAHRHRFFIEASKPTSQE